MRCRVMVCLLPPRASAGAALPTEELRSAARKSLVGFRAARENGVSQVYVCPVELLEREGGLAQLAAARAAATQGTGRVVFVTGEPGIGKTALVTRFVRDLDAGASAASVVVIRSPCRHVSERVDRTTGPAPSSSGTATHLPERAYLSVQPQWALAISRPKASSSRGECDALVRVQGDDDVALALAVAGRGGERLVSEDAAAVAPERAARKAPPAQAEPVPLLGGHLHGRFHRREQVGAEEAAAEEGVVEAGEVVHGRDDRPGRPEERRIDEADVVEPWLAESRVAVGVAARDLRSRVEAGARVAARARRSARRSSVPRVCPVAASTISPSAM